MPTHIRRIAKIYVKTLTGNTLDVELDLDDGEWRAQEEQNINNSDTSKSPSPAKSIEETEMDVVANDAEHEASKSKATGGTEAIESDETSSDEEMESETTNNSEKAKIKHLKQLVFEMQGIPPNQQRLVFQGKQLTDEDELDKTGLKDQTVHLVLALRGGCL